MLNLKPFKKTSLSIEVKKKRKSSRRVEDCHQIAYFEWLQNAFPLVYLVTAAIFNQGQRNQLYAHSMGLKAGLPDIVMFVPSVMNGIQYHGLFIELKRPGDENTKAGKLSDKQCTMIARLRENGYYVCVAFGWDEARNITKLYLGN